MIATNRIRGLLILCCVVQTPSAFADAPRQLMWEDLTPKLQASENPFSKLTKEQLTKLTEVAQTRDRRTRGDSTLSAADAANEQTTSRKLEDSGVDVDGLLAKRKEMAE